jgi:mannose-1-phosphate guanylyltransferase
MIPAVVLTAGLGTRLDPLTRLVAKGAVPVAGVTLVERVLQWLAREGVRDAVLNLHHRPDTITAAVGDGAHLGLGVRYSWEGRILGSAGGPRHALPLLPQGGGTLLIVNGDTLTNLPLAELIAAHDSSGADVTMAVIPNPAPDHYNGILAGADGVVTGFVPKGHPRASWHFVGIQVVRASVLAHLPDGVPAETVSGVYRSIVAESPGRIRVWPTTAQFLDVGTPADYLATVLEIAGTTGAASVIEPGAHVSPSARLTRSVVWADARVGADAALDRCIVAGPVAVPSGTRLAHRVIVPASLATPDDRAERTDDMAVFAID